MVAIGGGAIDVGGDGVGDHLLDLRLQVRDVHARQDRFQRSTIEAAHQFILQRQIEAGLARVALTPGAPTQLVVDTP
ncbi:Uncharacterised protein [Mycobacteroides abscessus subsp. abscessus]|nr:Uncharacterised protein [Mycobacteroides abscessus subsp. abscessus]